jgi:hypothetical protein
LAQTPIALFRPSDPSKSFQETAPILTKAYVRNEIQGKRTNIKETVGEVRQKPT